MGAPLYFQMLYETQDVLIILISINNKCHFSNTGPVFPGVGQVEPTVQAEAPISKGVCQAKVNPSPPEV